MGWDDRRSWSHLNPPHYRGGLHTRTTSKHTTKHDKSPAVASLLMLQVASGRHNRTKLFFVFFQGQDIAAATLVHLQRRGWQPCLEAIEAIELHVPLLPADFLRIKCWRQQDQCHRPLQHHWKRSWSASISHICRRTSKEKFKVVFYLFIFKFFVSVGDLEDTPPPAVSDRAAANHFDLKSSFLCHCPDSGLK